MVSRRQTQKMAFMALAIVFTLSFLTVVLDKPSLEVNVSNMPLHKPPAVDSLGFGRHENKNKITLKDKFVLRYILNGTLFNKTGRSMAITGFVSTSVIHSFSPEVERQVADMLVDPAHQQVLYANSPAMQWVNGELVVVLRIWLEKEKYFAKKRWPYNSFQDNFLFTQKFDRHLRPLGPGSVMGIPAPKQFDIGDGPIEPRILKVNDTVLVSFNSGMAFSNGRLVDYTVFWDYQRHRLIIPDIQGGSPMMDKPVANDQDMARDKHWCAFDDNGELYMVYNVDPLRVLKCNLVGSCKFVHFEGPRSYMFSDFSDHLRGGTPFELYKYPYYIGVVHVTLFKQSNTHRVYTANLLVLRVKPYRVVFVSRQIRIHPEVMTSVPIVRVQYIDDPFIFPVGIILEDSDTLYLGVHINDYSSVIVRIRGLKDLMTDVINLDKAQRQNGGPPLHSVQNYAHESAEQDTGYKLHKSNPA